MWGRPCRERAHALPLPSRPHCTARHRARRRRPEHTETSTRAGAHASRVRGCRWPQVGILASPKTRPVSKATTPSSDASAEAPGAPLSSLLTTLLGSSACTTPDMQSSSPSRAWSGTDCRTSTPQLDMSGRAAAERPGGRSDGRAWAGGGLSSAAKPDLTPKRSACAPPLPTRATPHSTSASNSGAFGR